MKYPIPILLLLVAATAMAGGYFSYRAFTAVEPPRAESPPPAKPHSRTLVGERRPDYTLGSADGSRVSASDFDGRVVLVNFWATWCTPCREEMPMLMELREELGGRGLEVVGIALDDVQQAREFATELGVEYPILVGSTDVMATMNLYGNISGTLPYSVLLDRSGVVRWTKLGVLDRSSLEREIEALLESS